MTSRFALDMPARCARLDDAISSGRLIREEWKKTDVAGRELVCMLVALSPEVGESESSDACPADVMPQWLAHLTPWIADKGSDAAWPAMVRKYAALAHRWCVLSGNQWGRLDYRVRAIAVREASTHTDQHALDICGVVAALCDRAGQGANVEAREWEAARDAAALLERPRLRAARSASLAAEESPWAAARAVLSASRGMGRAADRMTGAILDALEQEISGGGRQ
jgi:hypothetical protein